MTALSEDDIFPVPLHFGRSCQSVELSGAGNLACSRLSGGSRTWIGEPSRTEGFLGVRVLRGSRCEARAIRLALKKPAESRLQPGLAAPRTGGCLR
jgi:hypothetical protein